MSKVDMAQRSNIAFQLGRIKGIAFTLDSRANTMFDKAELAHDLLDIEKKIQEQLDKDYVEVSL